MKPSIAKGTRDFLPSEVNKRKYIFDTIEGVFRKYGFLPIETPAMELLQTLTGKYGEEGDKLLFKVLNNGDFLAKADQGALDEKNSNKLIPSISKRGLRYDLTVPFARFVVMNQNELTFPFKRFQIQPVWRADRPQKGRYQEFWQCDADVVGSDSLMYEAEIIQILHGAFEKLGIKIEIKVNNRKILQGIAEICGISDQFMDMTISIDKLDKIGREGVIKELVKRDIPTETAVKIIDLVQGATMQTLSQSLQSSKIGTQGIDELNVIFGFLRRHPVLNMVDIDLTLARGLNYYTGCIIEVVADKEAYPELVMGSIAGGGRYDNLTEVFGMKGNSGIGISFGADRIYDVMESLAMFPEELGEDVKVLFVSFDQDCHLRAFQWVTELRSTGIAADIYPEPVKMKKQMKYADSREIPFVAIIGDKELEENKVMLKDMSTGEQESLMMTELVTKLRDY